MREMRVLLFTAVLAAALLPACGGSGSGAGEARPGAGAGTTPVTVEPHEGGGSRGTTTGPEKPGTTAPTARNGDGDTQSSGAPHIALSGPKGFRSDRALDFDGTAWWWEIETTLAWPIGDYDFTVNQGDRAVTGELRLDEPDRPVFREASERAPSGGPGIVLEFAGYPPRSAIDVFLYGPDGRDGFPYLRALPRMRASSVGTGTYAYESDAADPPGRYALWCRRGPDDAAVSATATFSR
jgi:hypothetical protein